MKLAKRFIVCAIFSALGVTAYPQVGSPSEEEMDAVLSIARDSLNRERMIVISESLRLDPKEAASFWGVYEKYADELKSVQDARIDLIKDYFTDIDFATTSETAEELTIRAFDIIEKRLDIRRKYYAEFTKATDASIATRFMQVEQMIDSAIDLRIAQVMPAFPTKLGELFQVIPEGEESKIRF